jgi:hypothetical protein
MLVRRSSAFRGYELTLPLPLLVAIVALGLIGVALRAPSSALLAIAAIVAGISMSGST